MSSVVATSAACPRQSDGLSIAAAAIAVALMGLFYIAAISRLPIPDVAMQLHLASATMDGAKYGKDILEINPPLFAWIALPAVLVSRLTGIELWTAFVTYLFLIQLGVLVLQLVVSASENFSVRAAPQTLASACILGVVFPLDFGQREHFIALLLVPYVQLAGRRWLHTESSLLLSTTCATLAATAIALKPHFGVVALLVELRLLWISGFARTVRRVEPWLIVSLGFLYLLAIWQFAPDYFDFLRLHASAYTDYATRAPASTLLLARFQTVILLSILAWVVVATHARQSQGPSDFLLLATIGSLLAVLLQGKGFSYHYLPAQLFALLLLLSIAFDSTSTLRSCALSTPHRRLLIIAHALILGWYLVDAVDAFLPSDEHTSIRVARAVMVPAYLFLVGGITGERLRTGGVRTACLAVIAVVALSLSVHTVRTSFGGVQPGIDSSLPEVLAVVNEAPGESVAVLSTDPASGWPLMLLANAKWPFRYSSLAFLASFYPSDTAYQLLQPPRKPEARSIAERRFLSLSTPIEIAHFC